MPVRWLKCCSLLLKNVYVWCPNALLQVDVREAAKMSQFFALFYAVHWLTCISAAKNKLCFVAFIIWPKFNRSCQPGTARFVKETKQQPRFFIMKIAKFKHLWTVIAKILVYLW